MSTLRKQIPEGYMEDRNGRLVPLKDISELEHFRNDFAQEMGEKALQLVAVLKYFRNTAEQGIDDLAKISAEKYGVKVGGAKGNVSVSTFNGEFKLVMAVSKYPIIDERIQVVRSILNDCLIRFSEGGKSEAKAIFDAAFESGRDGMVSIARLRLLRDANIDDDQWKEGIDLLNELLKGVVEKSYIRMYQLDDNKEYKQIPLDLAGV